jgi:hypothetical protein
MSEFPGSGAESAYLHFHKSQIRESIAEGSGEAKNRAFGPENQAVFSHFRRDRLENVPVQTTNQQMSKEPN